MELMDLDLRQLIATGREQGYLTYQQVGKYLPDEDNSSEKLDNLLVYNAYDKNMDDCLAYTAEHRPELMQA